MRVVVSCSGKFHAFALVEQLQKNGVEVIFFTAYSSIVNPITAKIAKRKDKENINPDTIKTNLLIAFLHKLFRKSPQFVNDVFDLWVAKRIKKLDADVFIGWSGMSLNSIKVAKSKGWKTILERGSAHIEVQETLLKEAYLALNKDFQLHKKTITKELLEYHSTDIISIPSRFCKETFIQKGIGPDKIFENLYGVSSYFKPVKCSNSKHTTFLYLGKLSVQKGIHLLLPIIEELLDTNEVFEFRFIGAIEKEIEQLISPKIKLSRNIKFIGHIDHYSLNEEIGQCDVAIIPSIQDGFAMVALQILRVGLPLIITKNAGAEQLIINDENGWVVSPIQSDIKKQIVNCINKFRELKSMRAQIINNFHSELTWDKYGDRYFLFLKSVV